MVALACGYITPVSASVFTWPPRVSVSSFKDTSVPNLDDLIFFHKKFSFNHIKYNKSHIDLLSLVVLGVRLGCLLEIFLVS